MNMSCTYVASDGLPEQQSGILGIIEVMAAESQVEGWNWNICWTKLELTNIKQRGGYWERPLS